MDNSNQEYVPASELERLLRQEIELILKQAIGNRSTQRVYSNRASTKESGYRHQVMAGVHSYYVNRLERLLLEHSIWMIENDTTNTKGEVT